MSRNTPEGDRRRRKRHVRSKPVNTYVSDSGGMNRLAKVEESMKKRTLWGRLWRFLKVFLCVED